MKTAFRIVVGLVVITAVAYRTSPSHFKHVKGLYGEAAASKQWKLDADGGDATAAQNRAVQLPTIGTPEGWKFLHAVPFPLDFIEPAPETRYHDYYLVSTTTAVDGGGVLSFGIFRCVFDLRSKP